MRLIYHRLVYRRFILVILLSLLPIASSLDPPFSAVVQRCEYWVAPPPEGNDRNPGTFDQPWATLEYASDHVLDNHCTIWFKDGVYTGENEVDQCFTTTTILKTLNPYKAVLQNAGVVLNVNGACNTIFEGFVFRHTGTGSTELVVQTHRKDEQWAENIIFRDNIFHDSYNDDLLKIYNGVRLVTIENNVFYNQGESEQQVDVNSVTDVLIQDNIFFNDFEGSGRSNSKNTKHFIVIKDSNENSDGLEGSKRVAVRRNIFLNWQGGRGETFLQVGNDGKPYHEAEDVQIENNLLIGNTLNQAWAAFGVNGGKNISFINNTVVGNLPSSAYAFHISLKGSNPKNENIYFYNNIWSDPTGTMGDDLTGGSNQFSRGDPDKVENLVLDQNLYWNGDEEIPFGELVSPLVDDMHRVIADPRLNTNHSDVMVPRWTGSAFQSGNTTIRQEFLRIVKQYAEIPTSSAAIGKANPNFAPADDILGHPRSATPDLGGYEYSLELTGNTHLTTAWLTWSGLHEPDAASQRITYSDGITSHVVTSISVDKRSYQFTDLLANSTYTFTLTVHNNNDEVLARSNTLVLFTSGFRLFIPILLGFD